MTPTFAPLHVIAWRLFWFVPFRVFLALTCLLALLCWGRDAARHLWEEGT